MQPFSAVTYVAEARWQQLLQTDGSNARAHAQLGMLYSCGLPGAPVDLSRARRQIGQALVLNRAETGPQVRLGEIALLQGDEAAASGYLEAERRTNERSVAIAAAGGSQTDNSASAEGQTRRGNRPLLESGHVGPFALAATGQGLWCSHDFQLAVRV